jgi:hypothetical protein
MMMASLERDCEVLSLLDWAAAGAAAPMVPVVLLALL